MIELKEVIASEARRREAPPTCMYENRRQRINSSKIVVENSEKIAFSYFYAMNPFLE